MWTGMIVEASRNECCQQYRERSANSPLRLNPNPGFHARVCCEYERALRVALYTLQVCANLGGALVAEFTVLLERFVDDALQFERYLWNNLRGRGWRAVQNRIVNDC